MLFCEISSASNIELLHKASLNDCNPDTENISALKYVDLSGNCSSPWGVYCAIIRNCQGNSLTLCGDNGIEENISEITNSLEANPKLTSLNLQKIKGILTIYSNKLFIPISLRQDLK